MSLSGMMLSGLDSGITSSVEDPNWIGGSISFVPCFTLAERPLAQPEHFGLCFGCDSLIQAIWGR